MSANGTHILFAWGHRVQRNSKQAADQTALTIMKALNHQNDCTCRAKKWRDTTNFLRRLPKLLNLLRRHCWRTYPLHMTSQNACLQKVSHIKNHH